MPDGREIDSIYASITLDTNNLDTSAEAGRRAMDLAEKAARGLDKSVANLSGAMGQAATGTKQLAAAGVQLDAAMRTTAVSVQASGNRLAGFAQTAQASGRIIQDWTAGMQSGGLKGALNAVANNTEQLGQSLAKAAGLGLTMGTAIGGAFQLTAVGAQLALPYVQRWWEAFSPAKFDPLKTSLETIKDKIETLAKQPLKIATDRTELAAAIDDMKRLTAAAEAYNEVRGLKSKAHRQSETAVQEAIAESPEGGFGISEALRKSIAPRMEAKDTELGSKRAEIARAKTQLAAYDAQAAVPFSSGAASAAQAAERQRRKIQALEMEAQGIVAKIHRVGDTPETFGKAQIAAGALLKPAGPGEDVGEKQSRLASALEGAGKGTLASQIRGLSPTDFKEQEQSKEAADVAHDKAKQREDAKKKAEDAKNKAEDARKAALAVDDRQVSAEARREDEQRQQTEKALRESKAAARLELSQKRKEEDILRRRPLTRAQRFQRLEEDKTIDNMSLVPGRAGAGDVVVPGAPAAAPAGGTGVISDPKALDILGKIEAGISKLVGNTDDLNLGGFFQ